LFSEITKENVHNQSWHCALDYLIPGFQPREIKALMVWRREGIEITTASEPSDIFEEGKMVKAKVTSQMRFEKLPPIGTIPQTKVSYYSQADMGGRLPHFAVNGAIVGHLMYLSRMRKLFDKSLDIDRAKRLEFIDMVEHGVEQVYLDKEDDMIEAGGVRLRDFEAGSKKSVKSNSPLVTFEVARTAGETVQSGRAKAIIRAPIHDVLAFQWNSDARNQRKADTLKKKYVRADDHYRIEYVLKKAKFVKNRDFCGEVLWKQTGVDTVVLVSSACEHKDHPITASAVRGSLIVALLLQRNSTLETSASYLMSINAGVKIPAAALSFYTSYMLRRVTTVQQYFQKLRKLVELDGRDGVAMGEAFMIKMKHEKKIAKGRKTCTAHVRVDEICTTHVALKDFSEENDWFKPFMRAVVRNKLRKANDVSRKLINLSPREASSIGGGLAMALLSNITSDAAVDDWVYRFPALVDFDEQLVWFRPMMNTIAKRLLSESGWGLRMRLYSGAFLSVMDMISDIAMINQYFNEGNDFYAKAILISIVLNLAFQLLVVFSQNHGKSGWDILYEVAIVVFCIKPAVDAARVASGKDQQVDEGIRPEVQSRQ